MCLHSLVIVFEQKNKANYEAASLLVKKKLIKTYLNEKKVFLLLVNDTVLLSWKIHNHRFYWTLSLFPNFEICKKNLNYDKSKVSFWLVTDLYKNIFKTKVESYDWSTVRNTDIYVYVNKFSKTLEKIQCESFHLKIKCVSNNQLSKKGISLKLAINKG